MKNRGYAKFGGRGGGQIRCIMVDVQVAYTLIIAYFHLVERFRKKVARHERWWHGVKLVLST